MQRRFDKKKPLVFNPIWNRISDATGCYYRPPYRGIGIRADSLGTSIASKARPIWPKQAPSFQCGPVSPQNNVKPDLSRGHCQSFKLKSNQCFSNHDALCFTTLCSFNSHPFPPIFAQNFIYSELI